MTKQQKSTLLRALRSGKYKQTRGRLYRGDTKDGVPQMCCLGVACDVLLDGEWENFGGGDARYYCFLQDGLPRHFMSGSFPNNHSLDIMGLTVGAATSLASLNDTSRNYDNAIKFIEENL